MSRKSKSSRPSRGSSKNPQQPPPSDERPPPPRKTKPPPRLLPPLLEKQWSAEEIWALMIQTERSHLMDGFSDTPEYWNSIAPYFPGSSAENLRKIHLSIIDLQRTIVPWKKDEVQTLIASVYGYIQEPEDSPQWWGEIASNLPRRTALDCRVAYNTYGLSRWLSKWRQLEMRQPAVVPSSTIEAVITSSERTSIEPPKSTDKEKEQQKETRELSLKTKSKGRRRKKKKKKKQREETMEPSVPGSSIDAGGTSTNRFSEVSASSEVCTSSEEFSKTYSECTCQRSFVEPLKNWKLEDYVLLMKALTSNLHVDTDNACAMENIAWLIGGKTGEEVRYLILKWRPQLLAALEKADRITGSSSGRKDLETDDSSEE